MDVFKIDGRAYDVTIIEIEENFNILYSENSGRSLSAGARMVLDPLGTFYGHKITIKRKKGKDREFDELYDYVSYPRYDGLTLEAIHNQSTITYDAYVSSGKRLAVHVDSLGNTHWDALQINFTPLEAQVIP